VLGTAATMPVFSREAGPARSGRRGGIQGSAADARCRWTSSTTGFSLVCGLCAHLRLN
jgi:hypothetical protein